MMDSVGIPIDQLQRAAPIVSGFLLGYVAMLPLIGRIADLRGRVPGAGRGAGGVRRSARWSPRWPTTCPAWWPAGSSRASAAAGWCRPRSPWSPTSTPPSAAASPSASSRAVQELGSVLGPLFGAVVLAARRLAGDLRDQPGGRAGPRGRDPARSPSPITDAAAEPCGRRDGRRRRDLARRWRCCSSPWSPAVLVFTQPPPLHARPDLGPAVHPVRRRRPLADAGRAWWRWRPPLLLRGPAAAPPPGRWSTCAAGAQRMREADLVGAAAPRASPWPG